MRESSRAGAPKPVRCAIYTRKSTEEGLEQDFNSLDAQREACAAYILSQRHEGWTALPDIYDDGGYSGGNMDRPALKALLADVALGKVDVIVVYKVDRLTRSLADFAKIVDVLDARAASFVSVTQAFNTTTSMGRLTLNVLLSFAQFEREVTGERIRDKIAASKAKGMWMGGPVPLGYDLHERKLVINDAEAATVRHIFSRYLELGSGVALLAELHAQGVRSKARINRHGKSYGSKSFSRGALYAFLRNRLYVGEVVHRGQRYAGQHRAIVDRELFECVQQSLNERAVERRLGTIAREPSLLAGLLWDGHGRRMSPSHAVKQTRRYRYYVSQVGGADGGGVPAWRVSAPDLEQRVIAQLHRTIEEQRQAAMMTSALTGAELQRLEGETSRFTSELGSVAISDGRRRLLEIVDRIELSETELRLSVRLGPIHPVLAANQSLIVSVPISAVRTGKRLKLIIPPAADSQSSRRNPALIKLVCQAFAARDALSTVSAPDFGGVAEAIGYSRAYMADLLRLSYLAPDIIAAIFEGRQPASLNRTKLINTWRLPLDWAAQRQLLGFA